MSALRICKLDILTFSSVSSLIILQLNRKRKEIMIEQDQLLIYGYKRYIIDVL